MSNLPTPSVASKRRWLPLAIVVLLERGLDFFGVTSMIVGIALWAVALALIVWWGWPWLERTDTWFSRFVAVAFPVVILIVPLASVLPAPSTDWTPLVLNLIAHGWLFLWAASTVIVILSYVHRGTAIVEQSRVAEPQKKIGRATEHKEEENEERSQLPSAEERESIHRMRILWDSQLGGGSEAASKMSYLLSHVLEDIAASLYWVRDLLEPKTRNLDLCKKRMDEVIDDDHAPLDDVIKCFNGFWEAYVELAGWLHTIEHHESLDLLKEPHAERYRRWEAVNKRFYSQLQVLSRWPEYQGRLYHRAGDNAAAHQFLQRNHFPDDPQPPANYIQPPGGTIRQEIEQGIRGDLEKLAGRLTGLPFLIALRLGGLNKELRNWVADHYERYPDPNDDQELRVRLEQWRNLSEEEISEVQRLGKTTWKGAFDVKKYSTPYLDTHIGEIQSLPKEFRQAVIETKEDLSLFNQRVDTARKLLDRSFDSSLSSENHQIVARNLNETYASLQDDAMRIVERIDKLPPP